MNYQHAPEADGTAKTRNLLAEAAEELERLEIEAGQAFCRLTALAEVLARLERMAVWRKPEACGESQLLLSYISMSEWSIGSLRNLVDFLALGVLGDSSARTRPFSNTYHLPAPPLPSYARGAGRNGFHSQGPRRSPQPRHSRGV